MKIVFSYLTYVGLIIVNLCIGGIVSVYADEVSIVVPNSLEFEEGNIDHPQSAQDLIFPNGARGQIVYPSDQFLMVPDTHRYIEGFRWRPDSRSAYSYPR